MADWLEVGANMPAFSLTDDSGQTVQSSQWAGSPLVVYFYPKDDTPGCTKQACGFRDAAESFRKLGAAVIGISCDNAESHANFRDKHSLNFPLLVDSDHVVAEQFGAWREKNMYGKKTIGIQRSSFLINRQGKVAKVWKRVRVDGHEAQVISAIGDLT